MTGTNSNIYLPRMRRLDEKRQSIVSVLDVGSSKICCIVARLTRVDRHKAMPGRSHSIEVIGYGYQRSEGVKSGVIVDLAKAEIAIANAVEAAERMARIGTLESVITNLSCGRLSSEIFSAGVQLPKDTVRKSDIHRVLAAGTMHKIAESRGAVHMIPIAYKLDGIDRINDPRGMIGHHLGLDIHLVSGDLSPVGNLQHCIRNTLLEVEGFVASPYASGLATLMQEEIQNGVACLDMGGGTTTLSVFFEGKLVHVDAIAVGGNHVTSDIASVLSTTKPTAERLKTLQGSAFPTATDDSETLSIPIMDGDNDTNEQLPKSELTRIIQPRIEETLELIGDRLRQSGFANLVGNRIVLTGGASQLTGVKEVAHKVLGRNIRLGRPLGVAGLTGAAKGPAFSTSVGLLVYPQVSQIEQFEPNRILNWFASDNYLNRFGRWLRESF